MQLRRLSAHLNIVIIQLAVESNYTVLFVNYSLAPKAKYPVAVEEFSLVLQQTLNAENVKEFSINPNSTAVVVNFVGGNLAANLTSKFLNITQENRD